MYISSLITHASSGGLITSFTHAIKGVCVNKPTFISPLGVRLIYYIGDEADRPGEAAVKEGGMAVGKIGEYRLGTGASWDEYVERLEMFCDANKITTDEQKRAVLLSCCGEAAYGLIVTLVKPVRPTMADRKSVV